MTDGRDEGPGEPGGQSGHRQDEDAVWRSIVENYGDEPKVDDPRWSSNDRRSSNDRWSSLSRPPEDEDRSSSDDRRSSLSRPDPEPTWFHADEDDEGYTPPPPPPVPRPVGLRLLAWLGLFGVPVLVLALLLTGVSLPSWGGVLCLAWFVGSFVYLVATMSKGGNGDDWDDGARI